MTDEIKPSSSNPDKQFYETQSEMNQVQEERPILDGSIEPYDCKWEKIIDKIETLPKKRFIISKDWMKLIVNEKDITKSTMSSE